MDCILARMDRKAKLVAGKERKGCILGSKKEMKDCIQGKWDCILAMLVESRYLEKKMKWACI
jgi:hypothetical protein